MSYRVPQVYIAGPMRGRPDHNFEAFHAAASRFNELGWLVENPVTIGQAHYRNDPDIPGSEYLRADLRALSTCTAIALLPEWNHSTGARCEVAVALTLGLQFYDAETAEQIPPPPLVVINGGYERAPGPIGSLDLLQHEIIAWGRETFGEATNASRARHLLKEAHELVERPDDLEEMADIFFFIAQSARGELANAVAAKLEKNRRRQWGTPDADGVVEHVAEGHEGTPGPVSVEVVG